MIRRVAIFSAASCFAVALAIGMGSGPALAGARTKTLTVHVASAAWYAEAPPCAVADCSTVPPPNPYPEDTLHVAVSGGQEAARTYLAFDFPVPYGATLVDGSLTLPPDTNPQDGSLSPDQADLVACLVTDAVQPVRGSLAPPPKEDCDTSSGAIYDEKDQSFSVDLTPFSTAWSYGTGALALLPTKSAVQGNQTWHVTFSASKKESNGTPPIAADLVLSVPEQQGGGGGSSPSGGAGIAGGGTTGTSSGGATFTGGGGVSGYGSFGSPTTSTTTTTTVTQVPGQPSVQTIPPASTAGFAGPGFAYPLAWALPLAFLAGFGAIGRALTKELYRRGI